MKTVIQVLCKRGPLLREAISSDSHLEDYFLKLVRGKKQGRSPGWAKVHSAQGYVGAANFDWSSTSQTLTCWVVTKKGNKPYNIVGDFIAYLLGQHSKRILTIVLSQAK